MWFFYIFVSAAFSAAATILIKLGVKHADPVLATAIKTVIVVLICWTAVFASGLHHDLGRISRATMLYLVLSGLTTGGVWLCENAALKLGDVDTMVAAARCSMVVTMVLAFLFLGDPFTWWSALGVVLILAGTLLMFDRKSREGRPPLSRKWLLLTAGQILFASATTILGKIGISGVHSNLGTAIHSLVVLVVTWSMTTASGKMKQLRDLPRREVFCIALSGAASAVTWLTYYRGLQMQYTSIVTPADKLLSGVLTVAMAWIIFGEQINRRTALALSCVGLGTVFMTLPA